MKKIQLILSIAILLFTIFALNSCKKSTNNEELGGDTNIPLTVVNSETGVYLKIGGQNYPNTTIKVLSNTNGMVTYGGSINLASYPDSVLTDLASLAPALISYYKPQGVVFNIGANGVVTFQFQLKITSEGIQSYFVDGKPWTIKYDDAVGTTHTLKRDNGETLVSSVTEKTGLDDWPFSLLLIKTSEVQAAAPAGDPTIKKVTYRINHKFGLVYLKLETKDGKVAEVNLYPWFVM